MANLKQVDLDNYLIIEVPQGQKKILAETVADANGYTALIVEPEKKTNKGEESYIRNIIDNLTEYQSIVSTVIDEDEESEDFGKITLVYLDSTPKNNSLTKEQFGVNIVRKNLGVLVKNSLKEVQLKQLKEQRQMVRQRVYVYI